MQYIVAKTKKYMLGKLNKSVHEGSWKEVTDKKKIR